MMWLFAVLIVLALGGVALVAAGRGAPLEPAYLDRPDVLVPAGRIAAEDLRKVRFTVTIRGYRMAEVDALLARLCEQLDQESDPEVSAVAGKDGDDGSGDEFDGSGR